MTINIEKFATYLKHFYSNSQDLAEIVVRKYIDEHPKADKSEVFIALSHGRGKPSTHCSANGESQHLKIGFHVSSRKHYKT